MADMMSRVAGGLRRLFGGVADTGSAVRKFIEEDARQHASSVRAARKVYKSRARHPGEGMREMMLRVGAREWLHGQLKVDKGV